MVMSKTTLKVVGLSGASQAQFAPEHSRTGNNRSVVHEKFVIRLFLEYREVIIGYLMKHQCSAEDAEDILQETYIRIIDRNNLEQQEVRAKNYIFTTAVNIWRDKLRRENVHKAYTLEKFHACEPVATLPGPDKNAQWVQDLDIIKDCLMQVRSRHRNVFLLRIIEKLTFIEIAEMLHVSTKTVQRDYFSTLSLCKVKMGEQRHG